jgi:predicted acylesterase/phospholipase RssA
MELGFLQRVRESEYWPRVGWIFGTSAGALAGTLAAVDRFDELERFLLELRPEETFRPHRLWQLPLVGLHYYVLPRTIEDRIGDRVQLSRDLAGAPIELVVVATDVTDDTDEEGVNPRELVWSARTTPPEIFAEAVLARYPTAIAPATRTTAAASVLQRRQELSDFTMPSSVADFK